MELQNKWLVPDSGLVYENSKSINLPPTKCGKSPLVFSGLTLLVQSTDENSATFEAG
jgi:hypothetical protein